MEAAADDLLQRSNKKEYVFHKAMLNQLRLMGLYAAETIQFPISETTVHRLPYTTAPENNCSFEKIVSQLSTHSTASTNQKTIQKTPL